MVVTRTTRNPSGCFAGCLHITRGNVNFDVLTGFKACLNDAFSNNILTATVPSFKADLRYTNRKFAMKIYLEMYRSGRNENDSKSNWLFGSGFPILLGFMRVFRLRERTIFGRSLLKFSPKFSRNARSILKFNIWSITQVVVRGRTRNAIGRETGARVRLPDAPPERMDRWILFVCPFFFFFFCRNIARPPCLWDVWHHADALPYPSPSSIACADESLEA